MCCTALRIAIFGERPEYTWHHLSLAMCTPCVLGCHRVLAVGFAAGSCDRCDSLMGDMPLKRGKKERNEERTPSSLY
jgi:hypothetical protein